MLQINLEIQRHLQDHDTKDVTYVDILGMSNTFDHFLCNYMKFPAAW